CSTCTRGGPAPSGGAEASWLFEGAVGSFAEATSVGGADIFVCPTGNNACFTQPDPDTTAVVPPAPTTANASNPATTPTFSFFKSMACTPPCTRAAPWAGTTAAVAAPAATNVTALTVEIVSEIGTEAVAAFLMSSVPKAAPDTAGPWRASRWARM